ncbi:hypothetical protein LCGC14_1251450 [marine sediment metagenome]|uniref:Uncharacterized protein n=1 Tax=marine sediment metagenome TaxID=412755 RepID=A0A0F9L2Z4_9ZZZZ
MTWEKTVMNGDQIVVILGNARKPCSFEFKDEPKIRAVAKAQAEITGDIAYKKGQEEERDKWLRKTDIEKARDNFTKDIILRTRAQAFREMLEEWGITEER